MHFCKGVTDLKKKIIAVVGPTASGKTALSVELAKMIGSEIISCDSMQIYKGLDIATAKVTEEEMRGVKHHLIDFLPADKIYSVSDYVTDADNIINKMETVPILAGGTGLYLRSLVYGVNFTEHSAEQRVKKDLELRVEKGEAKKLFEELLILDPKACEKIHVNNTKRLIRALEYCIVTGEKFSEQSIMLEPKYDCLKICLGARDRQFLYDRSNLRVEKMIESGLIKEAERFYKLSANNKDITSAQIIGYKELFPYFKGEMSLNEAIDNIKTKTRNYAKRQLTWFRREENANWIYIDDGFDKVLESSKDMITDFLKENT